MTHRAILGFMLLALLALSACTDNATPAPDTAVDIDINDIAINIGTDTVSAEGRIVPLDSANLALPAGGQVAEIPVSIGQSVAAGDLLIQLDTTNQELALAQAEAGLRQAEANITTAEANIISAQAALAAASAGVDTAVAQVALLEAGATDTQIALSQSQVAAANAGVQQAAGARDAALENATAAQIRSAEADLAAANAAVVPLQIRRDQLERDENASQTQRDQAQLQLNAGLANVQAAQARLDELRSGPTTAEQQAAQGGVGTAIGQREASEANLNLLLAGTREEQIAIAQTEVTRAQNGVAEAEIRIQQAEAGLSQAQTALAEAELQVAQAQAALDRTRLLAPFAGTVADITVKENEVVQPGIPVITLADFSGWRVETSDLTELNVVGIARGFPVEIRVDAFPDEPLQGVVSEIAQESALVLGDVTYRVEIDLTDDRDLPLRWGMTTFVNVDTSQ